MNEQPTLRDQFAMAALAGMLSNENVDIYDCIKRHAEYAYYYADAMLKVR